MCKRQLPNILIMKDFDLKKYLAEGKLLKEDINSILRDGGYDEIDDEDLLIKVERKYEEGMSAEELNDLTMDIESEEGGNIYEDSLKESDSFMIPSGWTDGGDDYSDWENNPGETVIKVFSAPMEGWDKEHEDMIMIKKGIGDFNPDNEEKFFVDGYISYGDYGTPDGPFDSYDDAFKVAVEAMEELKQDWK